MARLENLSFYMLFRDISGFRVLHFYYNKLYNISDNMLMTGSDSVFIV